MKEKPILFSGPMVKAILGGQKRQTRRVIKPQPIKELWGNWIYSKSARNVYATDSWMSAGGMRVQLPKYCPYGQPGDRLWVRETWNSSQLIGWKPSELPHTVPIYYRADDPEAMPIWRPSIFMPRWASRITLEITGVGVERVQEISEEDAKAEGISAPGYPDVAHEMFAELWDTINAKRGFGWEKNPWVWVITFKALERN